MSAVIANLLREKPIVVTGMGSFSSAGDSVEALWRSATAGRSLAAWRNFGNGDGNSCFAVCSAPEIDNSRSELRSVRKLDRSVQMAWLAANQAWEQAGLANIYAPERIGVMIGSSRGPLGKRLESLRQQTGKLAPSLASDSTFGSLTGALAQSFKVKGPGGVVLGHFPAASRSHRSGRGTNPLGQAEGVAGCRSEGPFHPRTLGPIEGTGRNC